ncbi:hypothetical protein GDI2923 [Gluconacetobacter diazotrophicus PA1 5]|uniref:Uncharacterized protein n=1 Tax=Gluconacetobacter diazotrophicus (strain ATCC 49037 / DSM 5601 / CCUG 37298 / CIP 103539 / LMG 7603 / PAl5) TaxID=272568 RepID=A9HRA9_GLUDA|nr:hypothetical protein GDI2923 [Gluconacetobacter diazotrophicus PA1 5]
MKGKTTRIGSGHTGLLVHTYKSLRGDGAGGDPARGSNHGRVRPRWPLSLIGPHVRSGSNRSRSRKGTGGANWPRGSFPTGGQGQPASRIGGFPAISPGVPSFFDFLATLVLTVCVVGCRSLFTAGAGL